jgi:hypothetical protein
VNSTLASKFGGPAQKWGRAGLKEGGTWTNHGAGWAPTLTMGMGSCMGVGSCMEEIDGATACLLPQ